MMTFLLVIHTLLAVALVAVILMQRSEGGGLGVGGSPTGFMSARGAADFLTRSTAVLATLFVVLSIALATLAVGTTSARKVDTSLDRSAPVNPADPLAGGQAPAAGQAAPAQPAAPADPLAPPAQR